MGIINYNTFASYDTATIRFCINPLLQVQQINLSCSPNYSIHTNETFYCEINYTQTDTDDLLMWSYFTTEPTLFSIDSNGTINYTTTPSSFGNHSSVIVVDETMTECNGSQRTYHEYNFTVILNNTPPEYYENITDVRMPMGSQKIPYYLGDHFRDIDEHTLRYTFLSQAPDYYEVEINNNTGEVEITSKNQCGEFSIGYLAEDPYDGYAISSPFPKLYITCAQEEDPAGGEGGGGGASRTCEEDWTCQEWSDCYPPTLTRPEYLKGYQKRYCYDQESCDSDSYEYTLYRDCVYIGKAACYPKWECGEWTPCRADGTQERHCIDQTGCNEDEQKRFGLPTVEKLCVYLESCADGIRNGNELGIDCGGPCEPCKTVELASSIYDSNKTLTWAIGILIFILLVSTVLYRVFRKQIKSTFSKLVWNFVKKSARQIYLIGENKKKIIIRLKAYENMLIKNSLKDSLKKEETEKLESDLYILFREVFAEILGINYDSSRELFIKKATNLETTDEFRKILLNLINRILMFESKGREKTLSFIDDLILDYNLLKFIIFNISDSMHNNLKQINIKSNKTDTVTSIIKQINKSFLMLQKDNINEAKEIYLEIIKKYEDLDEKDKVRIYESTSILFNILTYVSSHIENK